MPFRPTRTALLPALATALLAGCGGRDELRELATAPVEGAVLLDGKPVAHSGLVYFEPDRSRGNTSPYAPVGHIGPKGRYRMSTRANHGHGIERALAATKPGVPPGWYRVRLVVKEGFDADRHGAKNPQRVEQRWYVPKRYGDFGTSGLTLHVSDDAKAGAYDLRLTN